MAAVLIIMGLPQTVKKVKNGATYYYERTPWYDSKTRTRNINTDISERILMERSAE